MLGVWCKEYRGPAVLLAPNTKHPTPALVRSHLSLRLPSIHAIRAVYTALSGVEGVVWAEVGRAETVVEHDGRVACERLREAVRMVGFEVESCTERTRELPVL